MKVNHVTDSVERWGIWEIELQGLSRGNPFIDEDLRAEFRSENRIIQARGFYDGDGVYRVRCMPDTEGIWSYRIVFSDDPSQAVEGRFTCTEAPPSSHGPVRVANTFHFAYEDGTRYLPIGTTCYAWIHQPEYLREQTLETLEKSPFNKMRMCVFPKYYDYNHDEPEIFPYLQNDAGEFDFFRFNPAFFRLLEDNIRKLAKIGIEADLILFHPYDHWGFSNMGKEADDLYIGYITARLSAFRNVWWSLANEYDLMAMITKSKTNEDWERFGDSIQRNDPYDHLRSIHNCFAFYDHTKAWITHCSIQRQDVYKTAEYTDQWRGQYEKPVIIDECGYEGDINHGWGNLSAQELVRRFWEGTVRGGYVGHGETYLHPDDILWWSKGGKLYGESPERIQFLKDILSAGPEHGIDPIIFGMAGWDLPCGGVEGEYYLFYFGFNQPRFRPFSMPEGVTFRVDVIDTWNMTVDTLPGTYSGEFRIDLPGRQYMAVRMTRA